MTSIEERLTRPGGLASRLRSLRTDAGLTGQVLASNLGWGQSKVSKIETGKQLPTSADVEAWAAECGAAANTVHDLLDLLVEAQTTHREFRKRDQPGEVAIQVEHDALIRDAKLVRNAESVYIPGLLQTAEYARRRAEETARLYGADPGEIETAVDRRSRRQEYLYDRTRRFEFVVTEAALRLLLCSPAGMLAQLDRLMSVASGIPNIWFGVIPFGVELPATPQGALLIVDNEIAVIEAYVGETVHRGEQVAVLAAAMDELMAEARTDREARRLIAAAIDALPLA